MGELGSFGGLNVVMSPAAEAKERTFPVSRHRSARIRKKLVKRHGGEFRMVPSIWRINGTYYAHPSLYYRLMQEFRAA